MNELEQALGEWILSVAPDYEESVELLVDDDVDWSVGGSTVRDVDLGTVEEHPAIVVNALTVGTVQVQTLRATRWEPAEYERIDVDISVVVEFHLDGMGYASIYAEQMDRPFTQPNPDPRAV